MASSIESALEPGNLLRWLGHERVRPDRNVRNGSEAEAPMLTRVTKPVGRRHEATHRIRGLSKPGLSPLRGEGRGFERLSPIAFSGDESVKTSKGNCA